MSLAIAVWVLTAVVSTFSVSGVSGDGGSGDILFPSGGTCTSKTLVNVVIVVATTCMTLYACVSVAGRCTAISCDTAIARTLYNACNCCCVSFNFKQQLMSRHAASPLWSLPVSPCLWRRILTISQ